ncbi:hypothetical protein CANCADRAFT_1613 [Tortispora caseinolytica NRRL Y-17796]|uniref:DNA repair protein RAD14 n=1 Tax=Tortispora caseinolytica NRRL Y-17796 TaxID=767744 RepID=A0A1E4TDP0_9ASCO|nr:hypothetical protein CANCADRAFT_1613 [Tortispora caseinolytica NRRL Y-17796]
MTSTSGKHDYLANYIEYDLATMKDTKGGFIDEPAPEPEGDQQVSSKYVTSTLPPLSIDNSNVPRCFECDSPEIDMVFYKEFKCRVCRACKKEKPEKYSLLTKTECHQDYLLTEPELRDTELFNHIIKPNPHKSTYSDMLLYLRYQVEEYAFKKWNGPEGLDAEYERREKLKKKRKEKKFAEKIIKMKARTRTSTWSRRQAKHVHEWVTDRTEGNTRYVKCSSCGLQTEEMIM